MSGPGPDRFDGGTGRVVAAARRFGAAWLSRGRRAVLWSFLDQVILSGFGFAIGIATGRLVGIAEFGKFAIAMVFVTMGSVIYEAIFTTPMMTLAGHRERSRSYFGAVIVLGGAGAAVLGLLAGALFAIYYALRGEPLSLGLAGAIGMLVAAQGIQLTLRRVLFARRKGQLAATLDLARYGLFVAFIGALLIAESRIDTAQVLWGLALSGIAAAAVSIAVTGISGARLRSRIFLAAALQHWRIARWFIAIALVGFGQDQLLLILAGPVLGDAAIGGLRAALYLFGLNLVLMRGMENVLPIRAAAALSAGGLSGLKAYLVRFAIPFGTVNGALILLAVLPGAAWLTWLFGPAYASYVAVLQIMAAATAFTLVRDYLIQYFRAIRSTNVIFYSFVSGLVLSTVVVYPLVHWLGVEGLAFSLAISQFASMLYLVVAAGRHYLGHRQAIDTRRVVRV